MILITSLELRKPFQLLMLGKMYLVREIYLEVLFGFLVIEKCVNLWHAIWMDASPLINRIRSHKEEFINSQAKVSELIDNTKKW